jgi:ACS family sodium-dependent inorganic phosphate cotransporter-like MFS transporter 5
MTKDTENESLISTESESLLFSAGNERKRPSFLLSYRFLLSFVIFFGIAIQYMQRISMSIAIVSMINKISNKSNILFILPSSLNTSSHIRQDDGPLTFAWSKQIQGLILSSYFYGYMLTQIPGAWLSAKIGAEKVMTLSMCLGSIFTMLCAPSARLGYHSLIVCRFMTGLAHGAVWPSMSSLYMNWAPPLEKSRLIGFSCSGNNIGNILALSLGGWLCDEGFDDGWGSVFYIFGMIGIIWSMVNYFVNSDTPNSHRFISKLERDYINEAIGQQKQTKRATQSPPWSKMLTSKPTVALITCAFCFNWGNYLFLTQLPTFMKEVLDFDIKSNGLFSAIPYACCFVCAVVASISADRIIFSKRITPTNTRKIFNGLGLFIPMCLTVSLTFVDSSHPYSGVIRLAIGVGAL